MVGMPGCLPAVHRRSVSTTGCPPNPARRPGSRCPAVRCPAVQCPVIWLPRPDAVVQPAGVQPVRRPAVWCPARPASSRLVSARRPGRSRLVPRPPGGGDGGDLGTAGSGHDWIESSSRWSGPVLGGSVDGPRRHGCGHRCGGGVQAGGGAPAADLGRVVLRREAAPDRPGRPDRREGRCRWPLRWGRELAGAMLPHGTVRGRPSGLEPRLLCVVIAEPDVRVDGPGRIKRARRRGRRAAPARPRQVASATGSTPATL